jgi:hypothetical protein
MNPHKITTNKIRFVENRHRVFNKLVLYFYTNIFEQNASKSATPSLGKKENEDSKNAQENNLTKKGGQRSLFTELNNGCAHRAFLAAQLARAPRAQRGETLKRSAAMQPRRQGRTLLQQRY